MKPPPPRSPFTSAELEASIPFTPSLRLDGQTGVSLLHRVLEAADAAEARKRARKKSDQERHERTASALLANLLTARRNRYNAMVFVGVPFEASRYTGGDLSVTSLTSLREFLWAAGLVEGQRGYWSTDRWDSETRVHRHSRTTRLRATARLLEWVEGAGTELAAPPRSPSYGVRREQTSDLVVMRQDGLDPGPEPVGVKATRPIIKETNRLIAAAKVGLPDSIWAVVAEEPEAPEAEKLAHILGGDLTSVRLTRIFKTNWASGGRLYGGFWQNLGKRYRRHLTIDGLPTVELDYGRLHPTLLYAQAGLALEVDPYLPDGFDPGLRDLGKGTFGRFLNSKTVVNPSTMGRPADAPDSLSLTDFRRFAQALFDMHEPIWSAFGTNASVGLQYLDSEILLRVLQRMNALGAVALPVHDSVIVARPWGHNLEQAMKDAYRDVTGYQHVLINQASP